jgi:hypothetical protein
MAKSQQNASRRSNLKKNNFDPSRKLSRRYTPFSCPDGQQKNYPSFAKLSTIGG